MDLFFALWSNRRWSESRLTLFQSQGHIRAEVMYPSYKPVGAVCDLGLVWSRFSNITRPKTEVS